MSGDDSVFSPISNTFDTFEYVPTPFSPQSDLSYTGVKNCPFLHFEEFTTTCCLE